MSNFSLSFVLDKVFFFVRRYHNVSPELGFMYHKCSINV